MARRPRQLGVRLKVVVWVADGVWPAAVVEAAALAPADAEFTLVHVVADELGEVTRGAFAGLLGRRYTVGTALDDDLTTSSQEVLAAARDRLGRPADLQSRRGRLEREVVAAADGADLLVVARDGDRSRLGPRSLGPATRFVVDHAPCPVLLVWPGRAPGIGSIPPPPPPGHEPPPPPHERHH
ncbi:universal stress protein [Nakamurella sp.]|uniref:universal stress protein n=1 Tax=Nakamurella sp. TaxID=1869182 RepID=UPI0037851D38